eukprot:TRINITY_DN6923_c0_g1_i2.p1 TRINITY_DN6923_c0_g1~~TRINITY_DN6923_c0_g1_i2.p1  ORF type:complete len:261 (+),score=20.82 TRINITY_DN6923_c0_g1_i2:258-1040(+)
MTFTYCILRFTYLAWQINLTQLEVVDIEQSFLLGFGFYSIFTAYLFVLLAWVSAYHNAQKINVQRQVYLRRTKIIFIIVDAVFILVEVIYRSAEASGLAEGSYPLLYYFYLVAVTLFFSVGYLVYGILITRRLRSASFMSPDHLHRLRSLTRITMAICVVLLVTIVAIIIIVLIDYKNMMFQTAIQFTLEMIICSLIMYVARPPQEHHSKIVVPSSSGGSFGGSAGSVGSTGSTHSHDNDNDSPPQTPPPVELDETTTTV